MEYQKLDIDPAVLVPYVHNAKAHTEAQVEDLEKSLADFGQYQPVVVDENNLIIIGHGRVLAAIESKIPSLRVWRVTGYTDDQKRALRIVDNKLQMDTGVDVDKLSGDVAVIASGGYDINKFNFKFDFEKSEIRVADVDTTKEKFDAFANADEKQIVFYFDAELFQDVCARVQALRVDQGFENVGEAVLYLLNSHGQEIRA